MTTPDTETPLAERLIDEAFLASRHGQYDRLVSIAEDVAQLTRERDSLRAQVDALVDLFTYESLGEPGRIYARLIGDVEVTDEVATALSGGEVWFGSSHAVSAQYPRECPTCKAAPRHPCRTLRTGRVTDTHVARLP